MMVKKVTTVTEKTQSIKIKKAITTQNITKRTLTKKEKKSINKKGELNETPNIGTTT